MYRITTVLYMYLTHTGEVIGKLCEVCGVSVYRELEGILVTGVRVNLDRDREVVNEQQTEMVGGDGLPSSPSAFTEGSRVSVVHGGRE